MPRLRFAITLLLITAIGGCTIDASPPGTSGLDRGTIERYRDTTVTSYGRFAAIKLPIHSGVRVWNPIQIVRGPGGVMYGANGTGEIYSLRDTDGDGLEDTALLYADVRDDSLRSPASLAFRDADLYVGTAQEIRVYSDTDGDGRADRSRRFFGDVPHSEHPYEWTSGLTFGQDDHLYFILTTDAWNAGASPDPKKWRGAVMRVSPNGETVERFATGVRSAHGMAMNRHGDLFFADNQGGANVTEELHLAIRDAFYGYNTHKYGTSLAETAPLLNLQTEVAPSGMAFNADENHFDGTAGDLFVGFYGPGERWERGAVGRVRLTRSDDGSYHAEEHPVLGGIPKVSDLEFGPSGDLYVAQVGRTDYWYQPLETADGAFYRIVEAPWVEPSTIDTSAARSTTASADVVERGRQLFADLACSACHGVDGKSELLGPNLKDIGHVYSREELLEEIAEPSRRVKPSMGATRLTLKSGEVLLGRVVSSDLSRIRLMIIGNRIVNVPRADVASEESTSESMMYDGLLEGVEPADVDALLSYLLSLEG